MDALNQIHREQNSTLRKLVRLEAAVDKIKDSASMLKELDANAVGEITAVLRKLPGGRAKRSRSMSKPPSRSRSRCACAAAG